MVDLRYKKKDWTDWVVWPCASKDEAERITEELQKLGYEVEEKGQNPKNQSKRI